MEITFITEELTDYTIRPLLGDISTITLCYNESRKEYIFEGPLTIIVAGNVLTIRLISLKFTWYLYYHVDNNSLFKYLAAIEAEYQRYRNNCCHPIMDNYPAYQLLENLAINGAYGVYNHKNYTAKISRARDKSVCFGYYIEIQYWGGTIYETPYDSLSFARNLIVEFTNMRLPEEFYILPSNTKSAYKI